MYNIIHRTLSHRNVGAEIDADLEKENVFSSVFVFANKIADKCIYQWNLR